LSKILIATDGSKVGEEMVHYALDLASALKFEVFVIYVSDEPLKEGSHEPTVGELAVQYAVEEATKRGIQVESEIVFGVPAVDIVKKANDIGAKAIVLGSVGRSGLSLWIVGSVAERVIKLAYGPVIVVRNPEREDGTTKMEKMLIATDGSEANEAAVRSGLRLAYRLGMKVSTISVNDVREIPHTNSAEFREEINDVSKMAVAKVIHQGSQMGIRVDPIIEDGIPYKEITERSSDYDIVVIGTLGNSGFFDFRVGSVAEKVVRYSKCPVMVVRASEIFVPTDSF
jgi:nucleotide-binding universal stress UspA family protein